MIDREDVKIKKLGENLVDWQDTAQRIQDGYLDKIEVFKRRTVVRIKEIIGGILMNTDSYNSKDRILKTNDALNDLIGIISGWES